MSDRTPNPIDTAKPIASLSLDLDNQWSYLKVHGDTAWLDYPSYLNVFVPHVLALLMKKKLKITFFVVGKDAADSKNRAALQSITTAGHEIGNHSFRHEPWMHCYPPKELAQEIQQAEASIVNACNYKPVGFRGPGFSWSPTMIRILSEMGYQYDASTLPTYIGPLARRYYFATTKLNSAQKAERRQLFGRIADGRRAIGPYHWVIDANHCLQEIPVTTMPFFKTPFHLSYLLYLSRYSILVMRLYLSMAIVLCRLTRTAPSFLIHPLDLIGRDQLTGLDFFPGMDVHSEFKARVFHIVITMLGKHFHLISLNEHSNQLRSVDLKRVSLCGA